MSRAKQASLERCDARSPGERRVWQALERIQGELETIGMPSFSFVANPRGVRWSNRQMAPVTPDFVLLGRRGAVVLEIDGHQHGQTRGGDAHRDALIELSIPVKRINTGFTVDDSLLLVLLPHVREIVGIDRLDVLPCWTNAQAAVRAAIFEAA